MGHHSPEKALGRRAAFLEDRIKANPNKDLTYDKEEASAIRRMLKAMEDIREAMERTSAESREFADRLAKLRDLMSAHLECLNVPHGFDGHCDLTAQDACRSCQARALLAGPGK